MIKTVISGYGKMGHMVEAVLRSRGIEPVCATEDVCSLPEDITSGAVCIDFTTPDAFRANYEFLARRFKAVVVGTTGWYDIKEKVFSAFRSSGATPVERACTVLKGHGYTPDVKEIHHIHKLDAPSGTAKTVGGIIEAALGEKPKIASERIGEVPGTHIVQLRSEVDSLTFTHEAFSRQGFAEGAVTAALMTEGLEGVHEFKDLIL